MPAADELIRAGGATIAFDTNAVVGYSKAERKVTFGAFFRLCNDAERLRGHRDRPLALTMVIPALVRWEALHDLRVDRGEQPFDARLVSSALKNKAKVRAFYEGTAIRASEVLHRWFPSDDLWQAAKRDRLTAILGHAPSAAPATIDWAIAAQAEAEGWILVTDDTGPELSRVSRRVRKRELRAIMDALLAERGLTSDSR